jgi:hypothetical protein
MANVFDGAYCFFWTDLWNGQVLQHTYPELFSYSKDAFISVNKMKLATSPITLFHLPFSIEAYEQCQQLRVTMQSVHILEQLDQWSYIWGNNQFTSREHTKF